MVWIVKGEEKGKLVLVSKSNDETAGILHKGSYLTIEDDDKKFILRTEDTFQHNPYSPSPLIVDMDLSPLSQDQKCQNIVYADRIIEIPERTDGKSSFIKPQLVARISNQKEINQAFGTYKGIPVFPATVFARVSQNIRDHQGKFMYVKIPEDVFFYQTLITGATGSGKTVAMKYMSQYFLEELGLKNGPGAVLAVNVKEEDFLIMNKKSSSNNSQVCQEWSDIGLKPHGVETFRIYYPGNLSKRYSKDVDLSKCEKITLKAKNVDPETLAGLIQNITEIGADQLPAIFRYWKKKIMKSVENKLSDFMRYFADPNKNREYTGMNSRNEEFIIKMHPGTHTSVLNAISRATEYFDINGAKELNAEDILEHGKMSVIDVVGKSALGFGSVLLRDLLDKIYDSKSKKEIQVPILIIIDEVHSFWGNVRSREALQTLDSICRQGRGLEIGIIFASQDPKDIPSGINSVVNTKICFSSDPSGIKSLGLNVSGFNPEAFKAGYAVAKIHKLSQLRFVKFPLSLAGVFDGKSKN